MAEWKSYQDWIIDAEERINDVLLHFMSPAEEANALMNVARDIENKFMEYGEWVHRVYERKVAAGRLQTRSEDD